MQVICWHKSAALQQAHSALFSVICDSIPLLIINKRKKKSSQLYILQQKSERFESQVYHNYSFSKSSAVRRHIIEKP